MDNTDRELIALLRENARTPVMALAKKLRVARATVQNRLVRLEERGIIMGYTIRLQADALDRGIRAITSIGISGHHAAEVKHALRGHPNVVAIHTTNGRWDLMAELRAETLEAFDKALNTIRSIQYIENTETSILLSTFKMSQ
ncbi:Lrp/AsnC family transcriptional regulator [Pseudomonas syringae]|uniref:AsnC family transcriptional regulator n=1 Tax=Pseudomonas syringae pv. aceris TaxID=199198 RepID=A0A0L8IWS9_PSESX|nr:Lrp/AsnC family transcriptional regulator [Pseudomonas syringae]EGH72004.1 AsnC family transcriptional regulator [Pseudomonas syringae pv. aceris str. M302273]KOG06017.1 AsnC family transcriptional regulator [Pseudomonas syringae pv. aceris]KPW21638.1 AsnC family transcriptional regulator [Pseudomonas syringae pv. aceris]MCH5536031.1 Lrp/AsnC family transcriptional regulator [Pseudomonas syringae pv. syringae]MDF5775208.1 Lrp/AsnC family transcriptional regulator [Pseudomonas syringae pv. s